MGAQTYYTRMPTAYRLFGVESSPYTVKVRAVLRYRRLPHRWICRFPQMYDETRHVRPAVMPAIQFPDGNYHADSTPIILELEADRPGERSVLPENPGHAFLARVIEDMADEWFSKCLFHYRFAHEEDGWYAARWVMSDANAGASDCDSLGSAVHDFRERQIGRMPRVGCTPANAPLIEGSYRRLLAIMEAFVGNECFLFGSCPSLADFGLYGQLKTLATDPTAQAIMRLDAPYTEHWVRRLDDASGVDGVWDDGSVDAATPAMELLHLAGELYLPFLEANARALDAGEETVRVQLGGHDYEQPTFPYQKKCLDTLREALGDLGDQAREAIRPILEAAGCWSALRPG